MYWAVNSDEFRFTIDWIESSSPGESCKIESWQFSICERISQRFCGKRILINTFQIYIAQSKVCMENADNQILNNDSLLFIHFIFTTIISMTPNVKVSAFFFCKQKFLSSSFVMIVSISSFSIHYRTRNPHRPHHSSSSSSSALSSLTVTSLALPLSSNSSSSSSDSSSSFFSTIPQSPSPSSSSPLSSPSS